jgi:hypothetical protein
MDRRAAFGQIAAAGAVVAGLPSIASADGAVSVATKTRARGIYGSRIADLASAVAKGDFDAVAAEKNAFILFNSGAYAKDNAKLRSAISGTNAIFAAIREGDKGKLKSAYDAYVKANGISALPEVSVAKGQGYSSDFDFRRSTPAG